MTEQDERRIREIVREEIGASMKRSLPRVEGFTPRSLGRIIALAARDAAERAAKGGK